MENNRRSNIERFTNLVMQNYNINDSIDIIVNPELYDNRFGMTCKFLNDQLSLYTIYNTLALKGILISTDKSGIVHIIDKKTKRRKFVCRFILYTFILLTILYYSFILFTKWV